MAIAATTGVTASNASAGTSLVTGTFNANAGNDLVVAVAIATSGVTVSSITDTAGNVYSLKSSATNAGNVRVELWQSQNIAGNASNAVTVTVSAVSLLAVAVQGYSGTSMAPQNTGSATGTNAFPGQRVSIQDSGGFNVGALGFASTSGDTFTASSSSTIRRSVVPALTSVAVAIADQLESAGATSNLVEARLNASRSWAAAGLELRTGIAGSIFTDYVGRLPVDGVPLAREQRWFGTMPDFASGAPVPPVIGGGNAGYTG